MPKNKDKKIVIGSNPLFEGWQPQFCYSKGREIRQSKSHFTDMKSGEIVSIKDEHAIRIGEGEMIDKVKKLWVDPSFFNVAVSVGLIDPTLAKIWKQCIASKQDWLEFEIENDVAPKSSQYKVLQKLEAAGCIRRDKKQKIYWLSPAYFGGFNRLKKWEEYTLAEREKEAATQTSEILQKILTPEKKDTMID